MMQAKEFKCEVIEKRWVSPTVMTIRFAPNKAMKFKPGQFLSLVVPARGKKNKDVKRCYSFSNSPAEAARYGFELCVKYVPGGLGTTYLASLEKGDKVTAIAPFGDFQYKIPKEGNTVCFICTGTGIAPVRSIVQSHLFQDHRPAHSILLFGARNEEEILYRGEFERQGIEVVHSLSQASSTWLGFHGRVTDVLRNLPRDWAWHTTDFYICGNPDMVREVNNILQGGHGIRFGSIYKEAFEISAPKKEKKKPGQGRVLPSIKLAG